MLVLKTEKPIGILNPASNKHNIEHKRYWPAKDLSPVVEHYWIVRWNFSGGRSLVAETLPHPSVIIAIEQDYSRVYGVVRGKFTRRLQGKGEVFGVKFKPGAFYPLVNSPMSAITDRVVEIPALFGASGRALEEAVLSHSGDPSGQIEAAQVFLRERMNAEDDNVGVINTIMKRLIADRMICKVDDLSDALNINKRKLQRLFKVYVGVSPKWVIKRYRLHDAVEQLAGIEQPDWPQLALSLGYFDQAHFIRDFKAIVGVCPTKYAKKVTKNSDSAATAP